MAFSSSPIPLFTPRASGSSSGGGGGSSLVWAEPANSPFLFFTGSVEVYQFDFGGSQELYTTIRVPNSYSAGSQIRLRILWYSDATSGDGLLSAQSTLIRSEVDAITSTTNQRTTTNTAITLSAGTANEPQKVILDVTDSSGQVNGVSVSAGDLLLIRLYENGSTASGQANFLYQSCDVTFS